MTLRYFEVTALDVDRTVTEFDRSGMSVMYVSLIRSNSKESAEAELREEKRFRKFMEQNNLDWRTVPVVVETTTRERGI